VKKMSQRRKIVARRRLSELFAFAGTLVAIGSPVFAGPEGEQVMHGQASFSRVGPETTINVGTRSAIINYRGFDIPRGEIVRFIQPDASSRVLNRINSQMPSKIDGTLLANGHVYLVNPSGFVFGNNALINVGKFTAAAANMSDGDFLRGVDRFTDIKGGVVNQGTIQAVSGVTMVGRFISNSGVINGESAVMIASGSDVLIGEAGGHTYVRIDGKQIAASDAANSANKSSASGAMGLGAGDLYSLAISNAGTIKAKNVKIQSAQAGLVDVGGTINASNASGKGGRVEVLGDQISLRGAKIDASGSTGGGDVRIGGDFRGQGSLQTASTVHTDRKTTINVDAKVAGTGRPDGDDGAQRFREIEIGKRRFRLSGLNFGHLQYRVEQTQQHLARIEDAVSQFVLVGRQGLPPECLGEAEDRVQRGPNLVACSGQEGRFCLAGLFGSVTLGGQLVVPL
jgi:filamentous hemagglutinin family protein